MSKPLKLFTCPRCRQTYLGHDPLPDCPQCGYDYRVKEGFRWDVLVYLFTILGILSFFLMASYYRTTFQGLDGYKAPAGIQEPVDRSVLEKLPGSDTQ